jgi:uncharacterized membrane protein YbhN (UPF0104 family)
MKANKVRSALAIALLLLCVVGIGFYLRANQDLVALLTNLSWQTAVLLVILRFLFVALNGLFLKLFAAKLNVHLNWREWIGLPFITTMGNYLTPLSGGMLARAAYLKNRHALSYTHFATLLAANYLITFWVSVLAGLVTMPFLWRQANAPWLLLLFLGICWAGLSVILLAPVPRFLSIKRPFRLLNQALVGWRIVKSDRSLMWRLVSLAIASLLLNAAAFWLSYRTLQIPVSWGTAVMVSLATVFSTLTTITPGNFGIREAFVSFISEIVGAGIGGGLLVALFIRGTTLISAFTLGPLFSVVLAQEIRLKQKNHQDN